MKICPTCRRTYDDDALNFCLEDGSVLNFSSFDAAAPTIAMHQPRPTNQASSVGGMQSDWDATYPAQPHLPPVKPKKKSKAWLWALLILGMAVLLCGGGAAGLAFYVSSVKDDGDNKVAKNPPNNTTANTKSNSSSNSNSNSNWNSSNVDPSRVQTAELEDWVKESSPWGTTQFANGELQIASRQKNYYFVIVAPDDYKTDKATTRVTVRNVDSADSSLGYGLVIHSDTTPLQKDYAFLIDSKKTRYRVVRHNSENESAVTPWTNSTLIKDGSAENVLEVRDKGAKIEFYVNGQLATTITNKQGPTTGVPGLYAGDGVKVAFKKLEIIK